MGDNLRHAIEAARATYTDEEWEALQPRLRTGLIYRKLRRIDVGRIGQKGDGDTT